jgi:hypothetical protein
MSLEDHITHAISKEAGAKIPDSMQDAFGEDVQSCQSDREIRLQRIPGDRKGDD